MSQDFRGKRAFIYARVSTKRQANNDISVADQVAQAEQWLADRGAVFVQTFIEPGSSAKKDTRKVFQQMIKEATSDDHPVDIIVAHSQSRLFRNALDFLSYKARLKPYKVNFVSLTQAFGDDPASDLAMNMIAIFDEYHSAENAKHVQRTMNANARAGNWNGQSPPLGYMIRSVPQPKGKDRMRLVIDQDTADLPRLIFETYVHGTKDGPIGITKLAALLNERGERIRGRRFHVSNVQTILSNTAYMGIAYYNKRCSVTGNDRPQEDWIAIPVPPIVSEELFYQAQTLRASRDPKMGEKAAKTRKNLLTGSVVCGCDSDGCGGGMTTSTGKSGQYRYYACHKRASSGVTACPGRRIPMIDLDNIVIGAIKHHVLHADRLQTVLAKWLELSEKVEVDRREHIKQLKTKLARLDEESANVIKLVRKGLVSADDSQVATELNQISCQKAAVGADIDLLKCQVGKRRPITPAILASFSKLIAEKLGGEPAVRKAYVELLVDRVEVGKNEIRVSGSKEMLAHLAATSPFLPVVPKAEREWRTQEDSNLWPLPSEGSALSS